MLLKDQLTIEALHQFSLTFTLFSAKPRMAAVHTDVATQVSFANI